MFNRKDYPAFSYFMEILPALCEEVDDPDYTLSKTNDIFIEVGKIFAEQESDKRAGELKREILKIKAKNIDNADMQIILAQQYKVKFRQKDIPIIFNNILKGIDCKN